MIWLIIGALSLGCWIYLLLFNGLFWLERPSPPPPEPPDWPPAAAVVPARNEAETIARAVGSLLTQDYPGFFRVFLVDDSSSDGTAEIARQLSKDIRAEERLSIVTAPPLPAGWSGKVWAMSAGVREACRMGPLPEFFLFTDADIHHPPNNLKRLVARAEAGRPLGLVSLMARLNCTSFAEKWMIPAFVFFFAMLYPFRKVNDPASRTAGAAGGVMLARRRILEQSGGLEAIRDALIDDCSLAALMKKYSGIWLGLSEETLSLRQYLGIGPIWRMVARTAFTQLRYSGWMLAGTLAGLVIAYLAPPLLLLSGSKAGILLGAAAWLLMAVSFLPTVRFYGLPAAWSLTLPGTALVYAVATFDSARLYWMGKGGEWKGRAQAEAVRSKPEDAVKFG
jgi:hopene-associated glycosyltransferase HpnB